MIQPRRAVGCIIAIFLMLGALPGSAGSSPYRRPGETRRVSVASGGVQGTGGHNSSIYPDGVSISDNERYIAFVSNHTNLDCNVRDCRVPYVVPPPRVFRYDLKTRKTIPISVDSKGLEGTHIPSGESGNPAMSADGRYVAFDTTDLLDPRDIPRVSLPLVYSQRDVYLRDVKLGKTELISHPGGEVPADGPSGSPTISSNGRYVAFRTEASNLIDDDLDERPNVVVYDRKMEKFERVSVSSQGEESNSLDGYYHCASMSRSGRYVVFDTAATNLVPESPALPWRRVFLRDRVKKTTELISETVQWEGSCRQFGGSAISDDGRFVVFHSPEVLVPNKANKGSDLLKPAQDVYVLDRRTGRVERPSVKNWGGEGNDDSFNASISGDGRFVVFSSNASDFDGPDTGSSTSTFAQDGQDTDVFIHDRATGATQFAAVSRDSGEPARDSCSPNWDDTAYTPSISESGRLVAFVSCSSNLVRGDTNEAVDVFVRDMGPVMGVGGFGDGDPAPPPPEDEGLVCVEGLCIPPGTVVSSFDDVDDLDEALNQQGGNLYGASLVHRAQYEDLFAVIELEHMPAVLPGLSPIFYGLRFETGPKSYEVRASSLNYGAFGLFDCTESCTKVANLKGGYGTTGMRVVFSLPLEAIGSDSRVELKNVEAFSSLGSFMTGALEVLDTVRLQ